MAVKSIPPGFHSVTPYLNVANVREAIEFMKQAFDAKQTVYHDLGGGHVHGEVIIGDSPIMIGQTTPKPANIYLYVDDVDSVYRRALAAGATSLEEPSDKPYGDRNGGVKDPSGTTWYIATHKEAVSDDEIVKRFAATNRGVAS